MRFKKLWSLVPSGKYQSAGGRLNQQNYSRGV